MARRKSRAVPKSETERAPLARVTLKLPGLRRVVEFESITANTDDPAFIVVKLANEDGQAIEVALPRGEVKKLLSWRTLLSL